MSDDASSAKASKQEYEVNPKTPCCICKRCIRDYPDLVLFVPPCYHVQCEDCTYKHHSGNRCADCMIVYRYPGTTRKLSQKMLRMFDAAPMHAEAPPQSAPVARDGDVGRVGDGAVSENSRNDNMATQQIPMPGRRGSNGNVSEEIDVGKESTDYNDNTTFQDSDHVHFPCCDVDHPARPSNSFDSGSVSYIAAKRKMEESVPRPPSQARRPIVNRYSIRRKKK